MSVNGGSPTILDYVFSEAAIIELHSRALRILAELDIPAGMEIAFANAVINMVASVRTSQIAPGPIVRG